LLQFQAVRGSILALLLVAAAAVAAALAFSALANEREFDRQIAAGDQAVADEQPFQAIEAYSGAIARNPDSMLAHLRRGSVYYAQHQLEAALRDLRRATEIDPSALRAIETLADVHVGLGRVDRAIEEYESYVSIDDRSARVLYKLGLARYRAGRLTDAAEPLQRALSLDPAMGEAYYVLGLVQRDLDQLPAARKSLEEAARRSPASQTSAREALADVYSLGGEHARAIVELEALAALDQSRPERLIAGARRRAVPRCAAGLRRARSRLARRGRAARRSRGAAQSHRGPGPGGRPGGRVQQHPGGSRARLADGR
jgi:tetratricopeptide (TPR) repeat protein